MKTDAPVRCLRFALLAFVFLARLAAAQDQIQIGLNTVGYLPDAAKVASVAAATNNAGFSVIRAGDGSVAFSGELSGPMTNNDTRQTLYFADFSALKETGQFRLKVPGASQMASFRIATDLYRQPFYLVTRGMYLWRCGIAVSATNNGVVFQHDACHTNDAWLDYITGQHDHKDGTKGWHDAGDFNKYTVNAGITVGSMFRAWEDFGPALRKMRLDLPESGGPLPDFLAEIKWEMDWVLTMQADDGSVYHKLSTPQFCGFIMPEKETAPRYFTPWGSPATADFVAMTAMAARYFKPYDPAYAGRCELAALKSYKFLLDHPENHNPDQSAFSTGGYGTRDPDERLWAAAELWETTGEPTFLADLETRIKAAEGKVDRDFDWGEVKNMGLFTYLASTRSGRDDALVSLVHDSLLQMADDIVKTSQNHGYGRPLTRYAWGGNGGVARQTLILQAAYRLDPKPEYRAAELEAINYLLGRNFFGRSFVTGLGERPPMHPHDRRSAADNQVDPWPGYLVGGPNPTATRWNDEQADYRTNEIAINWNSALIYALAAWLP